MKQKLQFAAAFLLFCFLFSACQKTGPAVEFHDFSHLMGQKREEIEQDFPPELLSPENEAVFADDRTYPVDYEKNESDLRSMYVTFRRGILIEENFAFDTDEAALACAKTVRDNLDRIFERTTEENGLPEDLSGVSSDEIHVFCESWAIDASDPVFAENMEILGTSGFRVELELSVSGGTGYFSVYIPSAVLRD